MKPADNYHFGQMCSALTSVLLVEKTWSDKTQSDETLVCLWDWTPPRCIISYFSYWLNSHAKGFAHCTAGLQAEPLLHVPVRCLKGCHFVWGPVICCKYLKNSNSFIHIRENTATCCSLPSGVAGTLGCHGGNIGEEMKVLHWGKHLWSHHSATKQPAED